MNDATKLESSFDGAIDFFQNLRRGLGALEAGANIQNDRLSAISTSVATLQQGWQADHRTLTTLASDTRIQAGQLAELRTDGQRLDAQLGIIESLVANFQQDQQQLQQTLTTLSTDLQARQVADEQHVAALVRIDTLEQQLTGQTHDLHSLLITIQALSYDARTSKDHFKAIETQIGQHHAQLTQLEHAQKADQECFNQFNAQAETQQQDLQRIEQSLDVFSQTAETHISVFREQIEEQQSRFDDLTGSLATVWQDVQTLQETVGEQLAEQQSRFDDLTGSLAVVWQDAQTLQQDFARFSDELETQRPILATIPQTQQDLQKQQERIRHLETLMNKVSADTNSTRQILNVLQTDLTNQSDLLRELDQNWHHALATNQDRGHSTEKPVTQSSPDSIKPEQITAITDELANSQQKHEHIQQEVANIQNTVTDQNERLVNIRNALNELQQSLQQQWQSQQAQLNQLEAALADLQNTPAPEANMAADVAALQSTLATQTSASNQLQQSLQQQLQSQQAQLNQLEVALANLQNAPAPESSVAAADLTTVQDALTTQASSLNELQQSLQQQWQSQQAQLNQLEVALADLQNAPAPESSVTAADLTTVQDALTTQASSLSKLQQSLQQQWQSQQAQLNQLEVALADLQNAPESSVTVADLTTVQDALTTQASSLSELHQSLQQQLQSQQEQLNQLEVALADLQSAPAPEANNAAADVAEVHETLVIQTSAINDLREVTQKRFGVLENRQLDLQHTVESLSEWHQAIDDVRQQLAQLDSAITQQPQAAKTVDALESDFRHELNMLQQALTELEARIAGQTQAFSGNFDQFRALRTEIQNLQHNVAGLDALPGQLHSFGQTVNAQDRQISQIKEAVEYLQQDFQQRDETNPTDSNSSFAELTAQIDQQREQMEQLTATLETIQSESRLTQEKVITMATNVAKRIFELQNQLTASETVQSERLQDAEQKIIQLQAAIEMLQTPTKSRRWFKMPATLATVALTVGATFLGILAQVIWTTG